MRYVYYGPVSRRVHSPFRYVDSGADIRPRDKAVHLIPEFGDDLHRFPHILEKAIKIQFLIQQGFRVLFASRHKGPTFKT